jgi:tRNA threonylcarbamoyladenosine biosynthesis protein TsaB
MALILSIDTATEKAGISLSINGSILAILANEEQKEHAAWLHVAIEEMLEHVGCKMKDLQAIAVSAGPGSYTGLRVGMSAAKGLCYSLNIPLITENTLRIMAYAALQQVQPDFNNLICPMIDARRMEVFTAIFDNALTEVLSPIALVLDKKSFENFFSSHSILFLGSGIGKWKEILPKDYQSKSSFIDSPFMASHLSVIAEQKYIDGQFTDIINAEPVYIKEFHIHVKK